MNSPGTGKVREQRDDEIAQNVLGYLAEHPDAMDTLEGIASWWLLRHRIRVVVEQVERVLTALTDWGLLEAIGSGSERRYTAAG